MSGKNNGFVQIMLYTYVSIHVYFCDAIIHFIMIYGNVKK